MTQTPAPRDPAPDGDPSGAPVGPGDHPSLWSPQWRLVPQSPDWDEAYLAAVADDEDPGDPEEYDDPDRARSGHAATLAAIAAVVAGRRGPGMPGSAERFPGGCASPAAGFAAG